MSVYEAQQWCGVARGLKRHRNGSQDGKISKTVRKESDLGYTCAQQEPEDTKKKAGWMRRPTHSLDRFIDKGIDENLFCDVQLK